MMLVKLHLKYMFESAFAYVLKNVPAQTNYYRFSRDCEIFLNNRVEQNTNLNEQLRDLVKEFVKTQYKPFWNHQYILKTLDR
eukprot:UN05368